MPGFHDLTRLSTLRRVARKLLIAGAALALVAVVTIGLLSAKKSNGDQSGKEPPGPSLKQARKQLEGAPAPLAALHAQSSQLLGGGKDAFAARLRALRGYPVVVNKWGSWCGPCRAEFPTLQRQSAKQGRRVAFLGVDGQDSNGNARKFLAKYPVSYPSYIDGDLSIAKSFGAVQGFPSTVYYDRKGRIAYIKQGLYPSESALARDIRRYAR
jgi:cytochrome c biogenesis protein CcmG/thiol:disulfide interchange protein DsbE